MENLEAAKAINPTSTNELTAYHQELIAKYKDTTPESIATNNDSKAIIPFNGYYSLNTAPGAFFAVDTDVLVFSVLPTPIYFVRLLISLDGKTSAGFNFTGTFNNNTLVQNDAGLNVNLVFNRPSGSNATTASVAGTITLPGQSAATTVKGTTYNNPIPSTLFSGKYSVTIKGAKKSPSLPIPAMEIKDNYEVLFDNFANTGVLNPIPVYVYNMNMYFFTALTSNLKIVCLIMGTAAAGGLVCNNMDTSGNSRMVQTITSSITNKLVKANPNSVELAKLSGYYQLPSIAKGAFLSIQGEYNVAGKGAAPSYKVKIALSYDGVSSTGWYFEESGMSFDSNKMTLVMEEVDLQITFNRMFNSSLNSLVTITGKINTYANITGYTLFNPVPLKAFGGAVMTDAKGDSLTVVSDYEVVYYNATTKETTQMNNITYVPLMYILANPSDNPTTEMSFGTNGTNGNTCIVTNSSGVAVVSAIPGKS